jgi:hypothetical protein
MVAVVVVVVPIEANVGKPEFDEADLLVGFI